MSGGMSPLAQKNAGLWHFAGMSITRGPMYRYSHKYSSLDKKLYGPLAPTNVCITQYLPYWEAL